MTSFKPFQSLYEMGTEQNVLKTRLRGIRENTSQPLVEPSTYFTEHHMIVRDVTSSLDYDIRNGRTYMYHQGPVLYPFGYGLSYSDFAYEKIESVKQDKKNIRVTVSVKNTSGRDGEEVVQLYASYPDSKVERPSKQLRAFKRIPIKAGESREVTLTVPKEELGYWNEEKQMFVVEPGTVKLLIGASSEDIRLEGKIRL